VEVKDAKTKKVFGLFPSLREGCRSWNGNYCRFKRAVKSKTAIRKLEIYVSYIS
jgi:hypothetical protein